jgi:hypothetical protein
MAAGWGTSPNNRRTYECLGVYSCVLVTWCARVRTLCVRQPYVQTECISIMCSAASL